jgi:two-component system chemotaxis response regulator CheY
VAPADPPDRTVLIVEDAESCATTLEIALLSIPHIIVRVAPTARQALEMLAAGNGICAVVTDLNLPLMDGFELIERVRSDSRTARLPIVVISGDSDPHTPERLHRLGANAYFGKPYSPAQVRQKVEQLLDANSPSQSP